MPVIYYRTWFHTHLIHVLRLACVACDGKMPSASTDIEKNALYLVGEQAVCVYVTIIGQRSIHSTSRQSYVDKLKLGRLFGAVVPRM